MKKRRRAIEREAAIFGTILAAAVGLTLIPLIVYIRDVVVREIVLGRKPREENVAFCSVDADKEV